MPPTKKPVDELRGLAAPRELIEWVRKLAPETAAQTAWIDVPRAEWIPYLAVLRGASYETVLRATCECVLELAGTIEGPEATRVLDVLRATVSRGREALSRVEADFADLKLAIIAWGHRAETAGRPPWMYWAELLFELAHAAGRGNVMVGISLAMKMLASANTIGKPNARPAQLHLVARFRDKLTLADS